MRSSRILRASTVILSAQRTAIGSFQGKLAKISATKLGGHAIKAAVANARIQPTEIDEVFLGNVISAGIGQSPARQAAIFGGLPQSVDCTTVNKVCASGTKSIYLGAQTILAGTNKVVLTGGFESMSNVPYYLPKARSGMGYGHGEVQDGLIKDGLWDAYTDQHMGSCAELCAEKHGLTREMQDVYALESYQRALNAQKAGLFKKEIVPLEELADDEEPGKLKLEKVRSLRTAFKTNGTVTAANASSLNDGAVALVVSCEAWAKERGKTPMARIIGWGDFAHDPVWFTTAPSFAVPIALKMAKLTIKDVDVWELNEAFSAVSLINNRLLGLDPAKVNINGGAVALGHPLGASGARIVTTLLHVLEQQNKTIGVAAICNGGGAASCIVVERLN